MNKDEFKKEYDHFCSCINFKQSALDSEAIRFMNEFNFKLLDVIKKESSGVVLDERFTNDSEFKCKQCDNEGKCFSVLGETNFCPNCGSRFEVD